MPSLEELLQPIQDHKFGVLAESNTHQLTVIAHNSDVAIGDLFLLPCSRGGERIYIFRTTEYANILNRSLEMNDVARNKLTMADSYLAKDLLEEQLIELKGILLGYSQRNPANDEWSFHRPRRLPQHLSDVYHVDHTRQNIGNIICTLMRNQLGQDGIFLGNLLAGEHSVPGVPVYLPPYAFSHHIGIFGRTGCGKSNLMMLILRSIMSYNQQTTCGDGDRRPISIFAIDPHDEFRLWHANTGGARGIQGIVQSYDDTERQRFVEPFYYLSARNIGDTGLERKVVLSRADIVPDDLISVMEFTEQQIAFSNQFYSRQGENWILQLLLGNTHNDDDGTEFAAEFLPGTISAVQRRLGFLYRGNTRVFTLFDPEGGVPYTSSLPDIICALEKGRVIVIDSSLMNEMEQFLLTTIVARVLFSLRKALRSSEDVLSLEREIRDALGNNDSERQIGMRSLADEIIKRIDEGDLPYRRDESLVSPDSLPYINVVIEEAPSILNPQRMKFGSVFRDISRQGRKFGIGLSVISQQVSEIDKGILTQINTELNMALGNELERKEAIRNSSADLYGFERELQVLGKGQVIVSASYKDVPLPIQVPDYDETQQ